MCTGAQTETKYIRKWVVLPPKRNPDNRHSAKDVLSIDSTAVDFASLPRTRVTDEWCCSISLLLPIHPTDSNLQGRTEELSGVLPTRSLSQRPLFSIVKGGGVVPSRNPRRRTQGNHPRPECHSLLLAEQDILWHLIKRCLFIPTIDFSSHSISL